MRRIVAIALVAGVLLWAGANAGRWLVVDQPERSDVIVVLGGDYDDARLWRGVELLRAGYGKTLVINASGRGKTYGKTPAERAQQFVSEDLARDGGRIQVCAYAENSTVSETQYAAKCLQQLRPASVLLVTSDSHTRRALTIFRAKMPQYQWSVAAVRSPFHFGERWWTNREWAKTVLAEWEKWAWWTVVDRWKK